MLIYLPESLPDEADDSREASLNGYDAMGFDRNPIVILHCKGINTVIKLLGMVGNSVF